jgi:hypothetical protein
MYRYEVQLAAVLDLTPNPARGALELSDSELAAADAYRCRQIGEATHYLGLEGILAPSATGEGTVLAVYFDRLHAESRIVALDSEPWQIPP